MKIELLIIDPQKDFCTESEEVAGVEMKGALFVPGANEDMIRVADMIDRIGPKLNDIHATLDSHHYVDIAHPIFWVNSLGNHPDPYRHIGQARRRIVAHDRGADRRRRQHHDSTWRPARPTGQHHHRHS